MATVPLLHLLVSLNPSLPRLQQRAGRPRCFNGRPPPLAFPPAGMARRCHLSGGYFLGHGALYVDTTDSPLRNVNSDLTGKPPLGQVFGSVP